MPRAGVNLQNSRDTKFMKNNPSRRDFMRKTLLGSAVAGGALGYGRIALAADETEALPTPMEFSSNKNGLGQGKIGNLSVSRILLGGNLLTHFTHSRDLKYVYNLCAHYNTDEKIMETMQLAEQNGVNTLVIHTKPEAMVVLGRYRKERGGKMQYFICPTTQVDKDPVGYATEIKRLRDMGAEAAYLWGVTADRLVEEGKIDAIAEAVEIAHKHGMLSGVGAHDLRVIQACEEHKIPADFYIKTFHHHDYATAPRPDEIKGITEEVPGYWCKSPQETIDVMSKVEKPWIAFKVMAAGAIPPENALQYVFDNGADFSLMGMFDFEIAEDVAIARKVLAKVNRTRPWRA
jgi:hypothetical protein